MIRWRGFLFSEVQPECHAVMQCVKLWQTCKDIQQLLWKLCFLHASQEAEALKAFIDHCCCVKGP